MSIINDALKKVQASLERRSERKDKAKEKPSSETAQAATPEPQPPQPQPEFQPPPPQPEPQQPADPTPRMFEHDPEKPAVPPLESFDHETPAEVNPPPAFDHEVNTAAGEENPTEQITKSPDQPTESIVQPPRPTGLIIGLLVLFLIAAGVLLTYLPKLFNQVSLPSTQGIQETLQKVPQMIEKIPLPKTAKDAAPTIITSGPPPAQTQPPEASPPTKLTYKGRLVLNGIMTMDDKQVALINNEIYEVGETVNGLEITNITFDEVELFDGKNTSILQLGK